MGSTTSESETEYRGRLKADERQCGEANPVGLTILNKSSEKATFSFIYNRLSWFDWTQHKKCFSSSTIELIILNVIDFLYKV